MPRSLWVSENTCLFLLLSAWMVETLACGREGGEGARKQRSFRKMWKMEEKVGLGQDSAPDLRAALSHRGLHAKAAEATITTERDMPAVPHPEPPSPASHPFPEALRRDSGQGAEQSQTRGTASDEYPCQPEDDFFQECCLLTDRGPGAGQLSLPPRCPTSRHIDFKALKD